uniref:Uncharacterized protein n=1 Tax=Octopus bimaculoides TaxID=37653 RepID=A0A0L8HQW2_OCTBM
MKQLLYDELRKGKPAPHKHKLRFKDCLKTSLKKDNILEKKCKEIATNCTKWRKEVYDKSKNFEMDQRNQEKLNRDSKKGRDVILPSNVGNKNELRSDEYGRIYSSIAERKSHGRGHVQRIDLDCTIHSITCHECSNVCLSGRE